MNTGALAEFYGYLGWISAFGQPYDLLLAGVAAIAALSALLFIARRRRLAVEAEVEWGRLLLQSTTDGVLLLDRKARVREANPVACRLLQRARRQMLRRPAGELLGPRLEARKLRQWARRGANELGPLKSAYQPPTLGAAKSIEVTIHVRRHWGRRIAGYLCLLQEVEAKAARNGHTPEAAVGYDDLTGLPSRERFLQHLERAAIQMAERGQQYHCSVLVLNLDRFKQVNAHLGPSLADQVLIAVAERLSRAAEGAYLARLEGDRFGILVEGEKDIAELRNLIEHLQARLAQPMRIQRHELQLSAAVGIVANAHGYQRAADLLRDATIAMSRARAKGLGQTQLFDQAMGDYVIKDARIEADLRKALDNGELRPVFQPIVDVQKRRVAGFETLMRWRHPEHGEISPGEFVTIAEESEVVVPIGRDLRAVSCRMLAQWQRDIGDRDLYLSFNLTDHEARRPGLVAELSGYLENHGLAAASIRIELVERMLLAEDSRQALDRMVELGVPLCIDDFGTGYSSLSRLHDAPVHTLKIDRSFVQQMTLSKHGEQIVASIIGLGRSLGVQLLAEGVETVQELRLLAGLGCFYFQGYLFSPPVEAEQVPGLLRDQSWVDKQVALLDTGTIDLAT